MVTSLLNPTIVALVVLGLTMGLWALIIVQDLLWREVSVVALVALTFVSLPGHAWYWWSLAGAALVCPRRASALALPPAAIVAGVLAGPEGWAAALAVAAGAVAWSLGWWGGADAVALMALGLRHGSEGLIVGAIVTALAGLGLMVVRERSLWGLVAAVGDVVKRTPLEGEIPSEAEMPAAAVLGVVGVVMEVATLWVTYQ
jgi:hypothetical protein